MKLNPDDPRLTAYALGELPENERAAIEAELEHSPECREAVEEIRQATDRLAHELAAEPCPELLPAQKDAIAAQLKSEKIVEFPRPRVAVRLAALAACFLVLLAGYAWINHFGRQTPGNEQLTGVQFKLESKANSQPTANPQLGPVTQPQLVPDPQSAPNRGDQIAQVIPTGSPPPAREPQQVLDQTASLGGRTKQIENEKKDNLFVSVPPAPPANSVSTAPAVASDEVRLRSEATKHSYVEVSPTRSTANDSFKFNDGSQNAPRPEANTLTSSGTIENPARPILSKDLRTAEPRGAGGFAGGGGAGGGGARPGASYERLAYDRSAQLGTESDSKLEDRPMTGRLYRSEQKAIAQYPSLTENSFQTALASPLSTFSIDVDTASYANMRRFLNENRMPPRDAVRVEELINYFSYQYPQPRGEDPFAASIEVASCPWNSEHRLVRIGLKGREIARDKRPPSNFVFLIDVSGSMQPRERLPLIKQALRQLVKKMTESDRVAIVVYASEAGIRLESTSCAEKERILRAIDELESGGSTNGGDGIQRAYRVAEQNFIREGVNRVLLCTDGDFNVGITDQGQLVHMIQEKAKSGVFLTTLGVGTDNYKDALMQKLADKGNGNYYYLDSLEEAQKVLIEQMNGTLVTIAKDVKIQIEFNPAQVNAYRLVGYEKRMLRKEDFNNDAKDAGEIGAGHTVTALYEIVPAGRTIQGTVDDLKYQPVADEKPDRYVNKGSKELLTLKLRYKQPSGDRSRLLEFPVTDSGKRFGNASSDFRFAAAVASFGMLLRDSEYKGDTSWDTILEWAGSAKGSDEEGYRSEFLNLVRKAKNLR